MSSRSKSNTLKKNGINGNNGNGADDTEAQWSTQSYTLEDLVKQFTLPQVVRCNSQTLLMKRQNPLPINLGQPLLIYDTRTIRKLLARNVLYDTRARRYNETDETIVIPADYEGSFVRLRSRTAKDQTVHHSIHSLATYKVPAFFNMSPLAAFHVGAIKTSNDYPRLEYASGNVFVVEKVIRGSTKVKPETRVLRAKSSVIQELRYLKCRDEREHEVLIPMSQPGEFVEILPNPYGSGKLSVKSADIIATQKFPVVVRYVYGGTKPRLTSFSGLFTLLDSFEENTAFGCLLTTSGFTMIELPMSSPMSFQLALNSHDLFHLPLLKSALRLFEDKGQAFKKDLKFKFKFAQRIIETGQEALNTSESEENDPPSATNSARFGITQTHIYL